METFYHFMAESLGLPGWLLILSTIIGLLLLLVPVAGLLWLVLIRWWYTALLFSVTIVYHQWRGGKHFFLLSPEYLKAHPRTWAIRFVSQFIFSPRRTFALSGSSCVLINSEYLTFDLGGFLPTFTRGKALRDFIENGWKIVEKKRN